MNFLAALHARLSSETPPHTTIYDNHLTLPYRDGAVVVTVAQHVRARCEPLVAEWAAATYFEDLVFGMYGVSPTQRRWLAFVQIAEEAYPSLIDDAHAAARRAMTLIGAPDAEVSTASFREDEHRHDIRSGYPWEVRRQLASWTLSELLTGLYLDATSGAHLTSLVRDVDDLALPAEQRGEKRKELLRERLWGPSWSADPDDHEDWGFPDWPGDV